MIFRNFAFLALVVASTTLNYASADRTKLRGRWQVGDAKDASVDDSTVDVADAGVRRRRVGGQRELKKNDSDDSKTSASSASKNVGADNNAAKPKKTHAEEETAVISNMAGIGNMKPVINNSVKPPKNNKDEKNAKDAKDKKDAKKKGGDKVNNDTKKKNDKNMETGMYAGTFNYAAVRPQAWNPSAVTLGSAQTSNTNYASPGATTGNMAAGNAVSSAGVYRVSQAFVLSCGARFFPRDTYMLTTFFVFSRSFISTVQNNPIQPPQQQQQPAPVINNNVPAPVYNYAANTNQQQQQAPPVVVSNTPVTNSNNNPGNAPTKVVATSANRGINNQATVVNTLCSIQDGCCSSSQCDTGCCNFNYGCTNRPTQSWMAKYADSFCM